MDLAEQEVSHNPAIKKKMMIPFDELPPLVQFSRAVFPPGHNAPAHKHDDMVEVFYVESGQGFITVDGVEHAIHRGCCVTVDKGESHELRNESNGNFVVIYFGLKTN